MCGTEKQHNYTGLVCCWYSHAAGLYFTLAGTVYLPGDTVLITDIGVFTSATAAGAGTSLVCVTTNVNTECCRVIDNPNGGALGEWHFPNGTIVPRYSADPNADFSRSGFTNEVRLNRGNTAAMSPTGAYEYHWEVEHW